MANEMVFAPWRTMDDFILSQSRFQVPTYDNKEKFRNRIVSNLIYYQTNYAISSILIFSFITFSNPFKMLLGLITMSLFFGLLYYFDANNHEVKKIKKEHPTLTMMGAFFCGFFFIYQIQCMLVFISGVMLPILFTILHAALRLRNMKNKMASVAEVTGFGKKTPMSIILSEVGVEPDLKHLS